jgi:hypothetical protein
MKETYLVRPKGLGLTNLQQMYSFTTSPPALPRPSAAPTGIANNCIGERALVLLSLPVAAKVRSPTDVERFISKGRINRGFRFGLDAPVRVAVPTFTQFQNDWKISERTWKQAADQVAMMFSWAIC